MSDRAEPAGMPKDVLPQIPKPDDDGLTPEELRASTVNFDYTAQPSAGGSSGGAPRVHRIGDPLSGGSVISWAELLREQQRMRGSEDEVVLGSLPEIQIDAVSDKDLVGSIQREGRPGSLPVPSTGARPIGGPPSSGKAPEPLPRHEDWKLEVSEKDGNNQSSAVDLLTAAKLSDGALISGDTGRDRGEESDVLAFALASNDGSSAVNLGEVPRFTNMMSNLHQPSRKPEPPRAAPVAPPRRPASKPSMKMPRPITSWLGGAALGVAATALGVFVWYGGRLPTRKPTAGPSTPVVQQDTTAAPTADQGKKLLEAGDPAAALAVLTALPDSPDVVLGRGQARWLEYLRQKRQQNVAFSDRDAEVAAARQDLVHSRLPEGMLWLGLMNETLGQFDTARDTYRNGADTYPEKARLFQVALARLDALTGRKPKTDAAQADPRIGFALMLILAQTGPSGPNEAGFDYWEAVGLARKREYSAAREALTRARAAHDERRLAIPRLGHNPYSDPRDDMFLHNCDQLLAYWELQASLRSSGFDADNPGPAIQALLGKQSALDRSLKTIVARLGVEKPDGVAAALETVIAKRKQAEDEFRQADKQLRMVNADLSQANTSLVALRKEAMDHAKSAQANLVAASSREAEVRKALAEVTAARKDADATVAAVTEKLKAAKLVGDAPKPSELLTALETLMKPKPAATVDTTAFRTEIAQLKELLNQSRSPAQMLDLWPVMLESASRDAAIPALADADAVAGNAKADALSRAKARAVKGLALLAQGEYAQARTALAEVRREGNLASDATWGVRLKSADALLNDPRGFAVQVRKLVAASEPTVALGHVERGLKVFDRDTYPADHARLLALRGEVLVKLDRLDDAERDANTAISAGAFVAGYVTSGRVAEQRGQWDAARDRYQKAEAAAKQPEERRLLRVALARVLARPDANVDDLARAEQLADEAIRDGQAEGHLVKSRVLYRQQKHTAALEHAMLGLKGVAPPELAEGWDSMVRNHPALNGKTAATVAAAVDKPDPAMAERLFAIGLRHYHAGRFAEAEAELLAALKNHERDARFLYFLGLSRLPLGKIEAAHDDFRRAAALEREGFPDIQTVSSYFERIQGPERATLNRYRR